VIVIERKLVLQSYPPFEAILLAHSNLLVGYNELNIIPISFLHNNGTGGDNQQKGMRYVLDVVALLNLPLSVM
jgi:hypothetical protein